MAYCPVHQSAAQDRGTALFRISGILHDAHTLLFALSEGIYPEYGVHKKARFFVDHKLCIETDRQEFPV
jgi:hypothetical protein